MRELRSHSDPLEMEREEGETDMDESIHSKRNESEDEEAGLEELRKSLRRGRK